MSLTLEYPPGATPLSAEEQDGLIPDLSSQGELNEFEQRNIVEARLWLRSNRGTIGDALLTEGMLRRLHSKMFGKTWKWAGTFRKSDKNIGGRWSSIAADLSNLCTDVQFWIDKGTYRWPDIGVLFHHRLVNIHPFPNGNGRHARLAADVLAEHNGQPTFPWGRTDIGRQGDVRTNYIASLRMADKGDFAPLIRFAVSGGGSRKRT